MALYNCMIRTYHHGVCWWFFSFRHASSCFVMLEMRNWCYYPCQFYCSFILIYLLTMAPTSRESASWIFPNPHLRMKPLWIMPLNASLATPYSTTGVESLLISQFSIGCRGVRKLTAPPTAAVTNLRTPVGIPNTSGTLGKLASGIFRNILP